MRANCKTLTICVMLILSGMSLSAVNAAESKHPNGVVAILNEPNMPVRGAASSPEVLARILGDAGLSVRLISAAEMADPKVLKRSTFDLVILPTGQSFPGAARQTFLDYLRQGGGFVSMGGYAFSNLLVKHDGQWQEEAKVVAAKKLKALLATDKNLLADGGFEKTQDVPLRAAPGRATWYRTNDRCSVAADGPRSGRFCAKVEVPPGGANAPTEFCVKLAPEPGAAYHASGWLKTQNIKRETGRSRLAYLAVYQFGKADRLVAFKHFALVEGTTDWKQYGLDFSADPSAQRIELRAGIYRAGGTAWFDDLRLVPIPGVSLGPMNTAKGRAANKLELSPEQIGIFDASFPLKRACSLRTAPGQQVVDQPVEIRGKLAGWAASGIVGDYRNNGIDTARLGKVDVNARWVPLLEACDRYGRPRGPVAAMLLNYNGTYAGSRWAYFGIENKDLFAEPGGPTARALQQVAKFLVRGTFLRQANTAHRLYREGEAVEAAAVVDNHGRHVQRVTVKFSMSPTGTSKPVAVARRELTLAPGTHREVKASLGKVQGDADLYAVRAVLELEGKTIDELSTGFVVESAAVVQSGTELRFADNYFTLDGRPMFLFGSDESAFVYLTPQENPLTWSRDLLAARDIGLNVYENLHYSNPGYRMTDDDWRSFRGMGQLTQKYNLVFMPGMLILQNAGGDDTTLAKQSAQCAGYAERFRDMPGCIYYVNGDVGIGPGKELWNRWLKDRYGTTERLQDAWGPGVVKGELGAIGFRPPISERWNDVPAVDTSRFLTWTMRRFLKSNVAAVRQHDARHPITSEYYAHPTTRGLITSGLDVRLTINGLDVSGFSCNRVDSNVVAMRILVNDLRDRGKGINIGEYGIRVHPAWTGEGGPDQGYSMFRTEQRQKRLFLGAAHYGLGLGVSKIQNWCLRDAQSRAVFPWGLFYPEQMVPKDVAYVHRNQSIIWRHFSPKYVQPPLAVCMADNLRLGNRATLGCTVAYRAFATLLGLHCNFQVIDDHHLDKLTSATKAIVYPSPMAIRDDAYAKLVSWVKKGGALLVTGDFSYDADRQRTRTQRFKELAGVEFIAENYRDVARPSNGNVEADFTPFGLGKLSVRPCVRVKAAGADVLAATADGQPVLVRHPLGQGVVYYLTDPLELTNDAASAKARAGIYAGFVKAAKIKPLRVEPNEPWLHVMAQPTAQGIAHVLFNNGSKRQEARIPTAAGRLEVVVRNGWPALGAVTEDGKVVAVGTDASAAVEGKSLVEGAGFKALLSLDGNDLRRSEAVLVAPFEAGSVELPPRPGKFVAIVGEFQNGKWTTFERIALGNGKLSLKIDADRATCLILVCSAGTEDRWANHLTEAMIHPERITGY